MSRAAATELEPLVNNFEHLSDKRRAPEALQTLRKIASLVKPLMRQRNWRVGTLAEFFPPENNLLGLNINAGQKICLRLRHAGDDTQFLPFENVLDTMLHELAHIVHGPHDQHFHALWDKLRDEHQALAMKGYTGEGFLGQGNKLGGRRIPLAEARRQARAAAERRKTLQTNSGQRLGGMGITYGQDPRAVIAAAAQRRQQIERGCASNTAQGQQIAENEAKKTNMTRTQAERDDEDEATLMQAYMDLIQEDEQQQLGDLYIPPSQENPAGSKALPKDPPKKLLQQQREIEDSIRRKSQTSTPVSEKSSSRSAPSKPSTLQKPTTPTMPSAPSHQPSPEPEPTTWTCEICTLVNPLQYLTCDACTIERPSWVSAVLDASHASPPLRSSHPKTSSTSAQNNALNPRLNAYDNHKRFQDMDAAKKAQGPIGWSCGRCSNFMEQEWWVCSVCGGMRASS